MTPTTAVPSVADDRARAARVAGLSYLATFALVVAAEFAIRQKLFVPGDVTQTLHNVAAGARLWRISVVMNVAYCVGIVVQVAALYVVLKPVSAHLALLASLWRMVYVATSVLMALFMLMMARAAGAPDFNPLALAGPPADAFQLAGRGAFDAYYVGLVFTSLAATLFAWLFFVSRSVPRALAGFGVAASAWCVLTTIAYLVDPGFRGVVNWWLYDVPMALSDIALGLWLAVKGVRPIDG